MNWLGEYFGATGGSNLESMLIGVSASAGRPLQFMNHNTGLIFAYTQSGFIIRIQSNFIPATGLRNLSCTFTVNGTALIYSDGVQVGTGAIATMTTAFNNAPTVDLGASLGRANPVITCMGNIWTRVLAADEVAWLNAEPFVFLRPVVKRVYYGTAAKSAPVLGNAVDYAISSVDSFQPAVFLHETQSAKTNLISGVGAVTESIPAASSGGGNVQVFIIT